MSNRKHLCRWNHQLGRWMRVGECSVLWNGNRMWKYLYLEDVLRHD